jgi:hypothetical protein
MPPVPGPCARSINVSKLLTILLIAFGLAYASLWWSYDRFYGEFGVAPQDVGLAPSGNASDLAGSAVQLGIWLLVVISVMAFLPIAALIATRSMTDSWPMNRSRAILAAASAAAFLALAALIYWWLVDGWKGLALLAAACLIFLGAAAIGRVITLSDDANLAAVTKAVPVTVPRLAIAIALAAAVIGITVLDLPTDAAQAGHCAASTPKSVPGLNLPIQRLHLPLLAVHARPATLTWLSTKPPANLPTAANTVYLGDASGSVIVYDRATHRSLRIPASDVAVATDIDAPLCPGVH